MALRLNVEKLTNEVLDKLEDELKWVLVAWENEVISKTKFKDFRGKSDVDFELEKKAKSIIAYLKANTYVLADSYGTGSLMLTSNPGFQEYKNSNRWNPVRKGTAITGRPEGEYVNAFGEKKHSSGTLEGKNIEGLELIAGSGYKIKIEPVSPSYALQMAEQWLYNTYLPRAYKNAIQNTNFAKYLIES